MTQDVSSLTRLIRFTEDRIVCTGGVVFIGDGKTGKTHTAFSVTNYQGRAFHNVDNGTLKKSVNLEWDYFIFQSNIEEYLIRTSSQIFIMPGQKGRAKIGEGLAFEDAADLYFHVAPIKIVVALILTYDLTNIRTFQELEYWLDRAIERDMIQPHTSIILLGTHLDRNNQIMVSDENIDDAKDFIKSFVFHKIGFDFDSKKIHSIKVSNVSGKGIDDLKEAINKTFLLAFDLFDFVFQKEENIN